MCLCKDRIIKFVLRFLQFIIALCGYFLLKHVVLPSTVVTSEMF